MSSTTFTVLRCDRCGHEAEVRQEADKLSWMVAVASEAVSVQRPRWIGMFQQPADVCPGCAELLFAWWQSREPVVQPAAPADAPPTPRRFTIEDRRHAEAAAQLLLRDQVTQAFAAAQEEPTSLLGGEIVSGGFAGVERRAAEIVEAVITALDGRAILSPPQPAHRPHALSSTPDDTGAAA